MGRIITATVIGGSVVALGWGTRSLLTRQAAIARERIGKPLGEEAVDPSRTWRADLSGVPLDLMVLGDSIAAGLGAVKPKQTLGGRLAKLVAKRMERPVRLRSLAVVGAESRDLAAQVARLDDGPVPHVAVIIVGGNDITHRIPVAESVALLDAAIERLRDYGAEVVVATCPDLGALRPVPQPLRRLASVQSRRLGHAQAEIAEAAGAHVVDLRGSVGAMFFDEPEDMFGLDRFHPSLLGYRRIAQSLAPAVVKAAQLLTSETPA